VRLEVVPEHGVLDDAALDDDNERLMRRRFAWARIKG